MEDRFKPLDCNDNDVLEFGDNTYKIARFKQAMNKSINNSLAHTMWEQLDHYGIDISSSYLDNWFNEGLDCEILQLGSKNWKKAKIKFKVSVEFYIEEDIETTNSEDAKITEPESPLDDLRRIINEDNT